MHLSGQLSDWSINDLLQIMQVTKKTGSLDIEGERRGRVHFRDGTVTGAELTGGRESQLGSDRGGVADILYVLSTLEKGSFSVGPADGPETPGWSVEDITADVEALRNLEGEVTDAGLFGADGIELVAEITEPITLAPSDWSVVVSLVQPFSFRHLEDRHGRGGAVRTLHTLHRLAIAETVGGAVETIIDDKDEDESEWLDRIADDVATESDEPTWLEQAQQSATTVPEVDLPAAAEETLLEVAADEVPEDVRGVSAPASTTLTDGVYDEIRRLRSKVAEK